MELPEIEWIHAAADRLDGLLRRELLGLHRVPRALDGLARPAALAWRYRFRRLPVLVEFADDCTPEAREELCAWLGRCGCRAVRRLEAAGAVAARAAPAVLRELVARPEVRRVVLDREVRALLDVAVPAVRAPELWRLGGTGAGVTVAVLDTGIHPHPDFLEPAPRLVAFHDLVHGRRRFYDDNGHGTHVAGIVAGGGVRSGGRYTGVAPAAGLVGVKVLNRFGTGRLSTVIAGVDWVIRHRDRHGIRVLNVSLGAPAWYGYRDDPLARTVGTAWHAGLFVAVAAGNEGPEPGTIATPGIHPDVMTVGAADDRDTVARDDDAVARFSSRGPTVDGLAKPDLVAPGVRVTAANAPGSYLARRLGAARAAYVTLSGTSMATPVVAGLAALLLSRDPALTPAQLKAALREAARDLGFDLLSQGAGLADGLAAWQALAARSRAAGPAA